MNYNQARVIAGIQLQNMPANIKPLEISRYYNNTVELIHNIANHCNLDRMENVKDDNHRIIASCMYRPGFFN